MAHAGLLVRPGRAHEPAPSLAAALDETSNGLFAGLRALATLELQEHDGASVLRLVTALAVSSIAGCEAAGVTLLRPDGGVSGAAQAGHLALKADWLQFRAGEGPSIEAATRGLPIVIPALSAETRWPRFSAQAATNGVLSSCSVPLVAGERRLGSLNLYSGHEASFEHAEEAAMLFAAHAAATVANVELYALTLRRAERAEEESLSDSLTGLGNPRSWDRMLALEESRCKRSEASASVVILDLDALKHLNDLHGHAAGDALLRRMGDTLRATSREPDIVARIGGDEFAVLAMDCDVAQAERLAERFQAALAGAGIAATLGVATRRREGSLKRAQWEADQAMLEAKKRKASAAARVECK